MSRCSIECWVCAALLGLALPAQAERADRYKTIHLDADRVSMDDARQVSTFSGKVTMSQGTLAINGEEVVVQQDAQGIRQATVTGHPASFRQKREGLDEYVEGFGGRIEYDAVANVLNMFGQARVRRGQDELRGEHVVYNARTESFQASGGSAPGADGRQQRVHVVIQPKASDVEAAPVTGDPLRIKPDTRLLEEPKP